MAKKKVDSFKYKLAQEKLAKFGWDKPLKTKKQKANLKAFWKTKAAYINYIEKDRDVPIFDHFPKRPKGWKKKRKGPTKTYITSKLKYRFKFQPLSPKQRKLAEDSHLFSSQQFTPTGIFIERPVNIDAKNYKISFKGKSVSVTADCRHDEIIPIPAEEMVRDPEKAVEDAINHRVCLDEKGRQKKVKTFSLMVNGFRSKHSSTDLKQFLWYIKNKLLPDWLNQEELDDEESYKFTDTFQIRLLY